LFLNINISVQKYKNIYGLGTSLLEAFYHNFDHVFCTVPNLIDSSNQQRLQWCRYNGWLTGDHSTQQLIAVV
jgi:hypothetical protein